MGFPQSVPFSHHSENLAEIRSTLKQIERLHKAEVRRTGSAKTPNQAQPSVAAIRRVHLLIVGILAEAILKKVIADPTGFEDPERREIWSKSSQEEQWKATVNLAFRRHFAVAASVILDEASLGKAPNDQRELLLSLISKQLSPVITDRNKIAHANWVWQLKSKTNDQFIQTPRNHAHYNYSKISSLRSLVQALGDLIHVLAVSEPTFQRDYDQQISLISKCAAEIDVSDLLYEKLCSFLAASQNGIS